MYSACQKGQLHNHRAQLLGGKIDGEQRMDKEITMGLNLLYSRIEFFIFLPQWNTNIGKIYYNKLLKYLQLTAIFQSHPQVIWSNLIQSDPIWSNMIPNNQSEAIWSNLKQFYLIWIFKSETTTTNMTND